MRTITLTEKEAGYLWKVLADLLNDERQSTYVQYGRSKHWRKSAYIGPPAEAALVKVHNQLMGDGWLQMT